MSNTKSIISAALAGVMGVSALTTVGVAFAADDKAEKCFGVVKAGKNDCQTATNACAGHVKTDRRGDAWVVCSETCALDLIGATYVRDVEPGEMIVVGAEGLRSIKPFPPQPLAHCIFEHVYFARPDSYVFGQSVNEVRTELGRRLAVEQPVGADVVVPIPDSGVCAATGFAERSGLPLQMGLIRNHYVGRTFIEPHQSIRHFGVRVKLNPVKSILNGRRVV